ncbi:MAG: hypothetical protein A3G87_05025 [Omnitrophica bacterium RIFCSPLOWO2_12_FULL_50_11]|nr:MAG: hypothetical protein A3G87_05025 [Omnitrophica bacterium RIFCSPLOWO2_12_FULL_50_11]
MSEIEIRKYQRNDAKGVKALIDGVLANEFPREAEAFPTDDLDDIASSYGKVGEGFFVATRDGKILGTIAVKQEDARTAFLRRLYVDSASRGQRLGGRLVDRAIQFCREAGYHEVIIKTTSSMQNAVRLCERKGFVHKARLTIGPIELLKLALFLKPEVLNRN